MRASLVFLIACGGGSSGPATPSGPPAQLVATPAPGDVQVATVEGRPVWGGCVADQIKRFPKLTRKQALDQCIDLELLAQAAEARQLATHHEVVEATRATLVRRLLDQFASLYPDPDSMRAQIDDVYRQVGTTTRPEIRSSWHLLVKVDKTAPQPAQDAARRAADQVYTRLKDETGLFPHALEEAKAALGSAATNVEVQNVGPMEKDPTRWAPEYVGAVFGIPDVGRVSPVIQTQFGFHVILLTELTPETPVSREQVFGGLRRRAFISFVDELMKKATTEVHPELLDPPEGTP